MRDIDIETLNEVNKQSGTYPIQLISLILNKAEDSWLANTSYIQGDRFFINNNHYEVTADFTSGNNFDINTASNLNLYLTNCYKSITHNNNDYIAGAGLLKLSPVEETQEVQSTSINIELSAVPITLLALIEQNKVIGGEVNIHQCFFNTVTNLVQGDVYHKWSGALTSYDHVEDNQQAVINVECKSIIGALISGKNGRFTSDTSIKQFNQNDMSASYIASMVDFNPSFGGEE
jgi:hypothetical protein